MKKQLLLVALLSAGVMNVEARVSAKDKASFGEKTMTKIKGWYTKSTGMKKKVLAKVYNGMSKFKTQYPNGYTYALTLIAQLVDKHGGKGLEKLEGLVEQVASFAHLPSDLTLAANAFLETTFDTFLENIKPNEARSEEAQEAGLIDEGDDLLEE